MTPEWGPGCVKYYDAGKRCRSPAPGDAFPRHIGAQAGVGRRIEQLVDRLAIRLRP